MAALAPLRVVVAHRPPFVFVNDSSGMNRYYGMLIDLLSKILLSSNLTSVASPPPTYYPAPINAGGALTDGIWTGEPTLQNEAPVARLERSSGSGLTMLTVGSY